MPPFQLNADAGPSRIRRQDYESEHLDITTSLTENDAAAPVETPLDATPQLPGVVSYEVPTPGETPLPATPQTPDNATSAPVQTSFTAPAAAETSFGVAPQLQPTPAPQPHVRPFPLTAPAIIGIVTAALLLFGIVLLLWRRRAQVKERGRLRKFELSVEKYGEGHGISNPAVRNSIQKVDLPRSFFDTDDEEDSPRKSALNFRLSSKAPPKSPTAPKSPKSVHQWFTEAPSEPMPELPAGERGPPVMQKVPSPKLGKGLSGPLRVINGVPEPWTPATPSEVMTSMSARQLDTPPHLPAPAKLPPQLSVVVPPGPPPRRSSLTDHQSPASRGTPVTSPQGHSPPSVPTPATTPVKPRRLPTPPGPPPISLANPSKYNQEKSPASASSQQNPTLPRLMTAVTRFTPMLNDELELQVGDIVRIIDEYKDGWCLVQHVGRMDSPRGVVPAICLQERKRIVPPHGSITHKRSDGSFTNFSPVR